MSECGELPYFEGFSDVFRSEDPFKSVLDIGLIKDEDVDDDSDTLSLQGTDMDWNVDNMTMEGASELFSGDLFDNLEMDKILSDTLAANNKDHSVGGGCGSPEGVLDINHFLGTNSCAGGGGGSSILGITNGDVEMVDSVLKQFQDPSGTCGSATVITTTTNNNIINSNNNSYDDYTQSISFSDLMNHKDEVVCPNLALGGGTILDVRCKAEQELSPTHSNISEGGWDSGVSTDEARSPQTEQCTPDHLYHIEHHPYSDSSSSLCTPQRSPLSGYGSSNSPTSSVTSSSCSSSPASSSGSSSPHSLSPPRGLQPVDGTAPMHISSVGAMQRVSNVNQSPPTTQFFFQKHPTSTKYTFNTTGLINNASNTSLNPRQSVTLVSANQTSLQYNTSNTAKCPATTKITPAFISRSQPVSNTGISSNNNNANVINGRFFHKSSASPSVVTLSGVNKTAGITKSPPVISVSKKHTLGTTIGSNTISGSALAVIKDAQQQQKPLSIICTTTTGGCGGLNTLTLPTTTTSVNGTATPVYKTVTVTGANQRFTAGGQQFVLASSRSAATGLSVAPRSAVAGGIAASAGKIGKTVNKPTILIPVKTKGYQIDQGGELRTIYITKRSNNTATTSSGTINTSNATGTITARPIFTTTASSSSSSSTGSTGNSTVLRTGSGGALHTFVSAGNRARAIGTSGFSASNTPGGLRTTNVSILKNLGGLKKEGHQSFSGHFVTTVPKEEDPDYDDDVELPKDGQALVLTDEERKLAEKERFTFPAHYNQLNKLQETALKRIRRKIRNKISAQDSRKRKKEYMDSLEEKIKASSCENDRLKVQLATLEERNKKLEEQLLKFNDMMSAASVTSRHSSHGHGSNSSSNSRQQHPSTFLLMMILSVALFIYPSVSPQGKAATELLTAVAHKMPSGGNTRSLLEAATAKLSVCHGDGSGNLDEEIDLELESKTSSSLAALESKTSSSLAALTDHDYTHNPAKRARYDLSDNYCMPLIDEHLPPPAHKRKLTDRGDDDGGGGGRQDINIGKTGGKESVFKDVVDATAPDDPVKEEEVIEEEKQISLVEFDADFASKFSKGVLETISRLGGNRNWTGEVEGRKALDSLSQSLVVELATVGTKRLREDIELE